MKNEITNIQELNVSTIIPDKKDHVRAEGFEFDRSFGRCTFFGNGAPIQGNAVKMAKSIKDKVKLVKRAKAVIKRWGSRDYIGLSQGGKKEHPSNVWVPFRDALKEAGFTCEQINVIQNYK